ncbi:oxidase [Methylocystis heyeri]|nr:oxidase [Methylocystis heyeri]
MLSLSLGYAGVWFILLLLLGVSIGTVFLHIGAYSSFVQMGIAIVQAMLVWFLFMNLRGSSVQVRLCAAAGLFWLIFLFTITFSDYLTRPWNGGLTPFSEQAARTGG